MSGDKLIPGDIRSYGNASGTELVEEQKRLRTEIESPKLSFSEKAQTLGYNAIVIGATLAPLTFIGMSAAFLKSPRLRKMLGAINLEPRYAGRIQGIGQETTFLGKASDALDLIKGQKNLPADKVQVFEGAVENLRTVMKKGSAAGAIKKAEQSALDALKDIPEQKNSQFMSFLQDAFEAPEKVAKLGSQVEKSYVTALKRATWGTAIATFGGATAIGGSKGLENARKTRAVENSTTLTHAERILNERKQHAAAQVESEPAR